MNDYERITTVERLKSIPRDPASMSGPIIRALGVPDFGEIYEGNDDGTWCQLVDAVNAVRTGVDLTSNRVRPEDIPLPAILLWAPEERTVD